MNQDRKDFLFILKEYHSYRAGFKHMRAWSYAKTIQNLREHSAYMIGLGVDSNAMPHQYKD